MSDEQDKKLEELEVKLDVSLTTEQQVQKLVEIADALRTLPSPLEIDGIAEEAAQVSAYIRESSPYIVIPRKAVPTDQERMAEVKKVIHSKSFVPINKGIRARLKPEKYESLDDYVARCAGRVASQSKPEVTEAVAKISELSRALLKEVERGRVLHASEKKTLKQQLSDHVSKTRAKISFKKDELFWKLVRVAKKHLKVARSYE